MGIFDKKETKDLKKQEEQKRIEEFMRNLEFKLNEVTPDQAKEDLKVLVMALVGFFGKENPKLFSAGKDEMWYVKEFLRTIVSVGTGAMMGGAMEDKVKDFMNLLPVIQRYANVQ